MKSAGGCSGSHDSLGLSRACHGTSLCTAAGPLPLRCLTPPLRKLGRALRPPPLLLVLHVGELARLRAEKPQWGKTLLLAIIASSLGLGYACARSAG